ncbi:MAG: hypothetical protein AAF936_09205 [Pseudomonadota bacterium]
MGNGLSNIVAAAILAFAIIWTGGFGGGQGDSSEDYEAWLSRAVGDIRNDIVISCGCCDGKGSGRAASNSF